MVVIYAIRHEERDDIRAVAQVKASLIRYGYRIDQSRAPTCHRNGGLWQYSIPVLPYIET